jgi:ribosomal protein S18 acetylase RimI-like enzyme
VIGAERLLSVLEATWPPAARHEAGPWTIRDGQGGGKRVSAATAGGPVTAGDIPTAEAAMRALGQSPLFMIRPGEAALDALLAARGYAAVDPVDGFAARVGDLDLATPPRLSAIPAWPPLAIQREIWAEAGIGPARIAVMERAPAPKTALLARMDDRAAGTAFVGIHDRTAMVHALEIHPRFRRRGLGRHVMEGALHWARQAGATDVALVVTQANAAGQALYASLGLARVGQYHYRMKREDAP